MKGSNEQFILNLVIWLIRRYLSDKYRLMTPKDLEDVVTNYLAQLPKLGISLVYQDQTKVGESDEQLSNSAGNAFSADQLRVRDPE